MVTKCRNILSGQHELCTLLSAQPLVYVKSCMFSFVFVCTESFRHQYLYMLEVMASSQYHNHILTEIKLQSVSLVLLTDLCCYEFDAVLE